MYKTNIQLTDIYSLNDEYLKQNIKVIINFLNENECITLPSGRYDIDDTCYVMKAHYDNTGDNVIEAHQQYIDAHFILEGSEMIMVGNKENLELKSPYDSTDDFSIFSGNLEHQINMFRNDLLILYPNDAHQTKGYCTSKSVSKLIFKFKI